MKKEELMHGDLLMYYGHLCRFVIRPDGAIIERLDDKSEYLPCSCESDKAEPIPLTDDILKANGFEYDDTVGEYRLWHRIDVDNIWTTQAFKTGRGDLYFDVCYSHSHRSESVHRAIEYVHTLQHALRLCGLDELADNFKIEK